jgi:hypothetical protein
MSLPDFHTFRLAGGTALALQIGHRTSADIDLFTDKVFDGKAIQHRLRETFPSFQLFWQNENGFSASINDVKVDVFNWHVRFTLPTVDDVGIRLMHQKEIGAMKLEAITDRKTKKDYADLFFLLKTFSLKELIEGFRIKYPYIDHKFVIESLLSADEADASEMPLMFSSFEWNDAKRSIVSSVNDYVYSLRRTVEDGQAERIKKVEELLRKKKGE